MTEFKAKSLCILGRQPQLGLAELESLYGAEHIKTLRGAALLSIPAEEINFQRLGGTIKTARILTQLPYTDWARLAKYLQDNIPQHLQHVPEGKFTLGLSVYGLEINPAEINRTTLQLKKSIKKSGRPVRVVPNKTQALSSAQVLHNKLTHKGAWELIFMADGQQTILAQTIFVQDIEAYAARDQARPARDPRVGMLPPKLAQIIINLAVGQFESLVPSRQSLVKKLETSDKRLETTRAMRVLDPFCGTGVILQEALLMGYNVLGTDIDSRMVEFSKTNVQWLVQKIPNILGHVFIEAADATKHRWPRFTAVASEVYLGRPLAKLPDSSAINKIVADTNTIIEKFLRNLSPQLAIGQRICLAVPAWRKTNGQFIHLSLIDRLTDMGYNRFSFVHARNEDLIYYREDQIVCRELVVLTKS